MLNEIILANLLEGFGISASLIMAIGAQNAFVLKQGLKKQYLFMTAFICFLCDSALIALGVTGIGELLSDLPILLSVMRWGGALFLVGYGIRSLMNVFHPHSLVADMSDKGTKNRYTTLLTLLGFTFLNPHTYLDTFLLIGTVGAEHPPEEHLPFIIGAMSASLVWFFGLTYGASKLSPLFKNPRAWQVMDSIMAIIMFVIAYCVIT